MFIRICLIIAIVATLTATGIGFVKVREGVVSLTSDRDNEKKMKEEQTARAKKAEKNYADEQAKYKKETEAHQVTKAKLAETESTLADTQKRATALASDLDKVKAERTAALQDLAAWKGLGISVDQVKVKLEDLKQAIVKIDAIEGENKIIKRKRDQLQAQIDELLRPDDSGEKIIPMPGVKGKVVAVDPKWDFVILDVGAEKGVLENGVLLVHRGGKLIAKVKIRSVQPDRCIANVLPGWKLADIMENDNVLY